MIEIQRFLGLYDTTSVARLKPGQLEQALDVDIDGDGVMKTRRGMTQVSAAASHSMFAAGRTCLVMQGAVMKRMAADGTLTNITTLSSSARVAWAELGGVVYYTNVVDHGRVASGAAREWGVRRPLGQPSAAAGGGTLPPGRYLYAATFVRDDGVESGTPEYGLVELASAGGITFSTIPQSTDPSVLGAAIYMSAPNGTELYRAFVAANGVVTYTYGSTGLDLGSPLHPDPVYPPLAGSAIAAHVGCLYVAVGDTIYASDQYAPDRFRLGKRFLRVPGPVTLLQPVLNGLYVGTDAETWFYRGKDFDELKAERVLADGAVPGTSVELYSGARARSDEEKDQPSQPAAMWMSGDGVVYGDPDGNVTKVTADEFGIPVGQIGRAVMRARDGTVSYVVTTRGNAAAGNQHP